MVSITHETIDTSKMLAEIGSELAGANVIFVGTTRRFTAGKETLELEYECYEKMALKKLKQLEDEASQRWKIEKCQLVHRVGSVPVGEASVAVGVSSAHRKDAFEAASWLIDTLKVVVPIWKQEFWADGSTAWVHPGVKSPSPNELQSTD